jgi:hypothetical protein
MEIDDALGFGFEVRGMGRERISLVGLRRIGSAIPEEASEGQTANSQRRCL